MPVIWRIAFRNIRQHRAKSLIIGTIITIGVMVIILGNALIDASQRGLRTSFIECYTGDLMIHGPSDSVVSVFGLQSVSSDDIEVPVIPDYEKTLASLKADPAVDRLTSMVVAYGMLALDESLPGDQDEGYDRGSFVIVNGVDLSTYFTMFPSLTLEEGRLPERGSAQAIMLRSQAERLGKRYGRTVRLGDKIIVKGIGAYSFRLREVEIVGFFKRAEQMGESPDSLFVDVDTGRVLGGLTLGARDAEHLSEGQTSLLSSEDPDSIFGEELADPEKPLGGIGASKLDFENLSGILGDTSGRERLNQADTGAWNLILVRLKNSAQAPVVMQKLKSQFAASGIGVTDWKGAAGYVGKFADIVRIVFVIAIFIVSVVAIIVMMNTLVVSVMERSGEIGTMRALGAQRSFVRSMFLTETLALTLFFGLVGSILALAVAGILNLIGIEASGELLSMLFGGKVLRLVPRPSSFVITFVVVFLVGYLAHLYPVSVALKIEPVRAMQQD